MLRRLRRSSDSPPKPVEGTAVSAGLVLEMAESDPLVAHLLDTGAPIEMDSLELDSPAADELKKAGVELVVPLISQGELIGTLNLGHRLSDQPYSTDDRRLLGALASQVAPAVRVAQLVKEQEAEAQERERIEQELRVASLIQQTLLPKELPAFAGWEIEAFYRPARAVGGDFYDFIQLDSSRLGLVIGDVTDKGVPAALVMATCRSMLRAEATKTFEPGEVLAAVNDSLVEEIPPNMFVTCLYGILEPASGAFTYAHAGHNVPYVRTEGGVAELRATGMPLGLMPEQKYDVKHARLEPGETMLLSSDGIVEAHDPSGEMYGFGRLMDQVAGHPGGVALISALVEDLDEFSTEEMEQEDDVTLVVVRRSSSAQASAAAFDSAEHELASFSLASEDGNERVAMEQVAAVVADTGLTAAQLEQLQTAVSEATMNAIEHGNQNRAELPVDVSVATTDSTVIVRITDHGGGRGIPDPETPDIEAKLAGTQEPRGWGLFLIEHMVDEMRTSTDDTHHTIELSMNLQGGA